MQPGAALHLDDPVLRQQQVDAGAELDETEQLALRAGDSYAFWILRQAIFGDSLNPTEDVGEAVAGMAADTSYLGAIAMLLLQVPFLFVTGAQVILMVFREGAVVILAGTNDIAGNTGPATNKMIQDNLASMAEIATANDIRVILASILPASDYPWSPGLQPAGRIAAINSWIRNYADENGHLYLDYYSALVDDQGGMQAAYTTDGVHVNAAGYAIMAGLAESSIAEALGEPRREESSGGTTLNFRPLDGCPRTTSSKRPIDCD